MIIGAELVNYDDLCLKMDQLVQALMKSEVVSNVLALPFAKIPIIKIVDLI